MDDKTTPEEKNEAGKDPKQKEGKKFEGSGIFTVDGKELPKIPGGYDFVGSDSGLGDNDFVDQ